MKILLVGAGAAVSTKDVETGFLYAFRELGVDVHFYDLGSRLSLSKRWLERLWLARGKLPEQKPSWADTLYRGSVEALEMALRYQVDWVFVISAMYLHPDALELLRRAGVRVAVLFTESPYEDDAQARVARLVDACWTTERTSVDILRQFNRHTFYVRHAYDPARHTPFSAADADEASSDPTPAHDVVFVGTGFIERIQLLERVDWTGIDLGLYGAWSLLSSRHRLRKFVRGDLLENARTVDLYRRSKIGLNLYRSSLTYGKHVPHTHGAESLNPRAYELAAIGTFQLSDHRAEIDDIFGTSVPTFGGPRLLERQLRAYLDDPEARQAHADEARYRVTPHTFSARAESVLADLEHVSRPDLLRKGA